MKKILYLTIALACLICFVVLNSESTSQHLKRVTKHDLWGPTCRRKCRETNGEICGYVLQSCCAKDHCVTDFFNQECQTGYKLVVAGCTTNENKDD